MKTISFCLAPHAPYTVSEDHLKAARALSDRLGCPIVIHISETKREVDDSIKAKGAPPIVYLDRIGFLNNRVIAAHVVWPINDELRLLKKLGVGIVHNPQSNMKLASGVAPVPQMLKEDLPVGLGTDGAASSRMIFASGSSPRSSRMRSTRGVWCGSMAQIVTMLGRLQSIPGWEPSISS